MKTSGLPSRNLLYVTAAILVLVNLVWIVFSSPPEKEEFKLVPTRLSVMSPEMAFPQFDAAGGTFRVAGKPVGSLAPFVSGQADDHTGAGSYVIMRMSDSASAAEFKQALNILADQGICFFAISHKIEQNREDDFIENLIYQIDFVTTDDGNTKRICVDRFTQWPAD